MLCKICYPYLTSLFCSPSPQAQTLLYSLSLYALWKKKDFVNVEVMRPLSLSYGKSPEVSRTSNLQRTSEWHQHLYLLTAKTSHLHSAACNFYCCDNSGHRHLIAAFVPDAPYSVCCYCCITTMADIVDVH